MVRNLLLIMFGTRSEYQHLVFYCPPGAGISVQAGIPDFRSPSGLFHTLKRDNPKEALTSGKDLFDASVFNVSTSFHRVCHPLGLADSTTRHCFISNHAQTMLIVLTVGTHNLIILSNDRSALRVIPGGRSHSFSSASSHS